MALALRERKEYNGQEIIVERPDGARATTLAHANPFIDGDGNLLGAVNVLVDISARKQAEEALRAAHDQLAEKVIARTVELTELSHHLFEVAESERSKLAGELHDDMGSLLTVLAMRLGRMKEQLEQVAPELVDEQQELIELLHATVVAQRRIVASLRPVLLDSFGLAVALRNHVEDWTKNSGIPVVVDVPFELPSLDAEAALALFRITQESLTNAAKHARATSVRISLRVSDGVVTLEIEDDGKGVAPERLQNPSSHGILGYLGLGDHADQSDKLTAAYRSTAFSPVAPSPSHRLWPERCRASEPCDDCAGQNCLAIRPRSRVTSSARYWSTIICASVWLAALSRPRPTLSATRPLIRSAAGLRETTPCSWSADTLTSISFTAAGSRSM